MLYGFQVLRGLEGPVAPLEGGEIYHTTTREKGKSTTLMVSLNPRMRSKPRVDRNTHELSLTRQNSGQILRRQDAE